MTQVQKYSKILMPPPPPPPPPPLENNGFRAMKVTIFQIFRLWQAILVEKCVRSHYEYKFEKFPGLQSPNPDQISLAPSQN